jgi:prepilin-type N-terminal cleavage/methylation domain-containing protein
VAEGQQQFRWTLASQTWPQDSMELLTAEVKFSAQGKDYSVKSSTLANLQRADDDEFTAMRIKPNNLRAFTLIEMILAIGIAAIVLVAVNAVFFTALHLRDATQEAVDEATPVDQALTVMRRDLECAVTPTNGTSKILSGDFKVGGVTSPGIGQPVAIEMFTATGGLSEKRRGATSSASLMN